MWNLFIALAVFFFVLANVLFSDLKYEKLIREIDYLLKGDKPIENDDVFVHDGEPIGEVISVEEKDGGIEAVVKIKEGEHE